MKKFKITWTDAVGYYTIIEAEDADKALDQFNLGEFDSCEPDGFYEQQSVESIEEVNETSS